MHMRMTNETIVTSYLQCILNYCFLSILTDNLTFHSVQSCTNRLKRLCHLTAGKNCESPAKKEKAVLVTNFLVCCA